jgi:serine/threonine-protein kinase
MLTPIQGTLSRTLSGRYDLAREVGRGGMASVYLAHDLRHEREVAIKVLLPELTATLGADRFLREIRLVARLQHPHILPLFDSGEADGLLYFVMPYVEGESLRVRLEGEGALPLDETLRIVRQVADALNYAHARGVVHRGTEPGEVPARGTSRERVGASRGTGRVGRHRVRRSSRPLARREPPTSECLRGATRGRSDSRA